MRLLKIIASLAVFALLTDGCGVLTHHAGATSHASGPALKRVWKISNGTVDPMAATVTGNTVIATVPSNPEISAEEASKLKGVFVDGRTGRIRGQATTGEMRGRDPATDEHGRLLVSNDSTDQGNGPEKVFTPAGRLVWRARTDDERFVGGYTTQPRKSGGSYWQMIRTTSGRTVARLPEPKDVTSITDARGAIDVQAVRPGLLVAAGFGPSGSQAALVDVSRPGQARLRRLRPPPMPAHRGSISPGPTAVGGGHVYMRWSAPTGKEDIDTFSIAKYDGSGTRPAWHVSLPGGAAPGANPQAMQAAPNGQPAPNGQETLAVQGDPGYLTDPSSEDNVWFLRPDTGAPIGPPHGREGQLALQNALASGRAYINVGASRTEVIDPRTGAVIRTITDPDRQVFQGALANGYLIFAGPDGLYAYR